MTERQCPPQLEQHTKVLINKLGDTISWRYDEKSQALLTDFAQNKSAPILLSLQQHFQDEWNEKNIKLAPPELLSELEAVAKLTKNQRLFTSPATTQSPAIVAMWWPWGHGGTFSLRLKCMNNSYDIGNQKQSFINKIKTLLGR